MIVNGAKIEEAKSRKAQQDIINLPLHATASGCRGSNQQQKFMMHLKLWIGVQKSSHSGISVRFEPAFGLLVEV